MNPRRQGSAAVAHQAAPESAAEVLLSQRQVRANDMRELLEARAEALSVARFFALAVTPRTTPAELVQLAQGLARSANRLSSAAAWVDESSSPK